MTIAKKEITVACNYLLRLIKAHVQLTIEQIQLFKTVFHDILSKRFVDHWFPASPHRGSAYRCLQTKHWKDPVLKSIAERSRLPLHRYLPAVFTMWIDPGEVAICFGDEGTWCPLYKYDLVDGQIHQEFSDGEETISSFSSDDDLLTLNENVKKLDVHPSTSKQTSSVSTGSRSSSSLASNSRSSSPDSNTFSNDSIRQLIDSNLSGLNSYPYSSISNEFNDPNFSFWPSSLTMSDTLLLYNQQENF